MNKLLIIIILFVSNLNLLLFIKQNNSNFKTKNQLDFNQLFQENQSKTGTESEKQNLKIRITEDKQLQLKAISGIDKQKGSFSIANKDYEINKNEALRISMFINPGKNNSETPAITLAGGSTEISLQAVDRDICVLANGKNKLVELDQSEKAHVSLILENLGNKNYKWLLISGGEKFWGEFISSDERSQKAGFSVSMQKSNELTIESFEKGKIKNRAYNHCIKAHWLPHEAELPQVYLKYDNKEINGVEHLKLNGLNGKVTQQELNGLKEYLIERPLLTTNYQNTIFASWTKAYFMEWVYDNTLDIQLLNRLIEQSRSLLKYRDDNYGKYPTRISDSEAVFTKGWSHFRGICYVKEKPVKNMMDIASLGTGINYPAAAAKTIAKHPQLWEKRYQGVSYKEIAHEMLHIVNESWDFVIQHYYDDKTNLLLSPDYGAEPEGFVPQWNRLFPLMSAGNTLVDAYNLLNEKNEKALKIDTILKATFEHFWVNSRIQTVNNKPVLLFPYGVYRWKNETNHSEDGGHFGFDLRGFRVFHESGRTQSFDKTISPERVIG